MINVHDGDDGGFEGCDGSGGDGNDGDKSQKISTAHEWTGHSNFYDFRVSIKNKQNYVHGCFCQNFQHHLWWKP